MFNDFSGFIYVNSNNQITKKYIFNKIKKMNTLEMPKAFE